MKTESERLLEVVRGACSTAIWSRGVELTRAGAVSGESRDEDEVVFLVARRGGMISRRVTLYPEDADWDCECSPPAGACEHVAAAAIAWQRATEQGEELPGGRGVGRVAYRFRRDPAGLALERVIVCDEESHPLETTLAALASGRVDGPRFVASQEDLATELVLGTHRRGPLPRHLLARLFRRMARCSDLTLDGSPIEVDADPVVPTVSVVDQGDGFRLALVGDSTVTEVFPNGAALCAGKLRPLAESRLTGREAHELPRGRYYGPDDLADLVTDVLPSLGKRVNLDVRTTRLPETRRIPPRITIETRREGDTLIVLAQLVYGDPAGARVHQGRLVQVSGPVPLRDADTERRLVRRLQHELGLAPGIREEFVAGAAVAFRQRLASWERSVADRNHDYFRLEAGLRPRIRQEGGRFDIEFESLDEEASGASRSASGRASAESVLQAWRSGESLVALNGGGWAPLPADWLARFGHRVADLLAARDDRGELPRCSLPDLGRLCGELDEPEPAELEGLRSMLGGFEGIPVARLPEGLTADLRDYQRQGVDWLVFLREAGLGAMLADDMGLGKTVQALSAIRGRTLVVCPTSVLHNWRSELARFRPDLAVAVYHGIGRSLDPDADATLTTYAILRLDAGPLAAVEWDTVVLDEAQAIKNPDSRVAEAAFGLRSSFRMTLSGTPVENRLEELWSQFHFINRGLLGGRRDFDERYARPIAAGEPDVAARLRERIRPFVLRRLKREVAPELPSRTEVVVHCELGEEERQVYDSVRVATLDRVVHKLQEGGGVLAVLEALLRLRQAACHGSLVPGQSIERSAKLSVLEEMLDSAVAEGHKTLVFSQWTSLLDLTEPVLRGAGIDFVRLDGSTRDRGAVVDRFQSSDGPPVLLVSLKAGGTGLNLTAADQVYLLDPWWNPAVEDQAADRAHRIGQDKPVIVYRLVAQDTVEERILALQARKREMAEAALGEADRAASITRDELLELLGPDG